LPSTSDRVRSGLTQTTRRPMSIYQNWFSQFLDDGRLASPRYNTKAYRHEFIAIATFITGRHPAHLDLADIKVGV
jgi:hypothetical protein